MNIFRPELFPPGGRLDMPLAQTHPHHMRAEMTDFLGVGGQINDLTAKIGADAVIRSGTFADAMLQALDRVSAHQQFSSELSQRAIIDPDSVNVEDITIAQAQASMALNITRNVLNRVVQGWRDIINTR